MTYMGKNDKVTLSYVPISELDKWWPVASPMIELARKRYDSQYGLDDVKDAIAKGKAVLWLIMVGSKPRAAMTTSEDQYPRRKVLCIELLGGDAAEDWAEDAVGELARVARAAGYDAIETKARRGWSKMAGKYNFRPVHVAYEMELNDGTR